MNCFRWPVSLAEVKREDLYDLWFYHFILAQRASASGDHQRSARRRRSVSEIDDEIERRRAACIRREGAR